MLKLIGSFLEDPSNTTSGLADFVNVNLIYFSNNQMKGLYFTQVFNLSKTKENGCKGMNWVETII